LHELKFTFTFEIKTEDCHNMSQSMSYFSIFPTYTLCKIIYETFIEKFKLNIKEENIETIKI